jgi:hypothetical protein
MPQLPSVCICMYSSWSGLTQYVRTYVRTTFSSGRATATYARRAFGVNIGTPKEVLHGLGYRVEYRGLPAGNQSSHFPSPLPSMNFIV